MLAEHVWPLFSRVMARDRARGEIYLANHSLGRPLDRMAQDLQEGLDLWYSRMDGVWDEGGWLDEINRFRANIALLIGLSKPDAVVPKSSAGQGLRAVLNALPQDRINVVATRGEFDSIDFILKTYASKGRARVRWVEPDPGELPLFGSTSVVDAITRETDLVVVSQVVFSTGQILPGLAEIIATAHNVGALVLVDAYHAVGVIPVSMEALDADFMVGGSYKYTRGGPGACWLAIHPRHLDGPLKTLDTGWFAKKNTFSYERPDEPEWTEGGDAWLESTPPVLTAYQARAGLELTLELGVDRIRAYQLELLATLHEAFEGAGIPLYRPNRLEDFGAFALLPTPDAPGLSKQLRAAGVNTDARSNGVRFGPDILTSGAEIEEAARITARLQDSLI